MAVAVARPEIATGAVTAAKGFVAGAVHAGIRRSRLDLAVVRSTVPAVGAGMFTANRVQAAPVLVSKSHLAQSQPQAIVINSGVANAATGKQGELDALATAAESARLLGIDPEQVLVLSTGVIGVKLPMERLLAGLGDVQLSPEGGAQAAEAILTTDTGPKEIVTTDYPLALGDAHGFLKRAVTESFNRISVDGECSTNDAVILLANGASEIDRTPATDRAFGEALGEVCADLSRQIVQDGEGATVLLEIEVTGAASPGEANAIAQRIATSPLVKTAAFGRDPNWGRILAAAGSAFCAGGFAQVDVDLLTLRLNGTVVFAGGEPTEAEVSLEGAVCRIELDLGLGTSSAGYLASDLTYDYVRINAEYTT